MVIGIIGMFFILLAFFMNQIGKWKHDAIIYDTTNFVGAFLLVIYSYQIISYPFLFLNSVWMFISLRDLLIDVKKNKEIKQLGWLGHKRRVL